MFPAGNLEILDVMCAVQCGLNDYTGVGLGLPVVHGTIISHLFFQILRVTLLSNIKLRKCTNPTERDPLKFGRTQDYLMS